MSVITICAFYFPVKLFPRVYAAQLAKEPCERGDEVSPRAKSEERRVIKKGQLKDHL